MLLLWAIIGAYMFVTDESRLRNMAADYLTHLVGGHVHIGGASLSIFEGLRLDKVSLTVIDGNGPQSHLFDAETVFIHYNLRALLAGRLEATQIVAVDPHVRLAEDVDLGRWNYQLLYGGDWGSQARMSPGMQAVPEFLMRNAQVDYLEVNDGKAHLAGWMAAEGRFGLAAGPGGLYEFSIKSHGSNVLGPQVDGSYDPATGSVKAKLINFVFGPDLRAMLPSQVRQWCKEHQLGGRLGLTLDEQPDPKTGEPMFKVVAVLDGGQCQINSTTSRSAMMLSNTSGTLVFTNDGIRVRGLFGWLDKNGLAVNGRVGGYTPDAPLDLTFASIGMLDVPENVPYVVSLPPAVRNIYQRLHPVGRATAAVHIVRAQAGAPIQCQATINVFDGAYTFREFPYPMHHVTGQILYGYDNSLGFDVVRVINMRGHGADGGPNDHADLIVNGWLGPMDERYIGGHFEVTGSNAHAEPSLRKALPRPAQLAWSLLDSDPAHPADFTASFVAVNQRAAGPGADHRRWNLSTDVELSDGHAVYAGFPYPIYGLNGKLEVRDGYVQADGIKGRHGNTQLTIGGTIGWDEATSRFLPHLQLTASKMPIDADLLAAVPAQARNLLQSLNATGQLDVSGQVTESVGSQPVYTLDLHLHDGAIAPRRIITPVTDLSANIHLTPQRLTVVDASGRRGQATLSGHGWVDWSANPRQASIAAEADNLALDRGVYNLMPANGRELWDKVHPSGTADIGLSFDNTPTGASTQLTIRPRHLSVAPTLAPGAKPLDLRDAAGVFDIRLGQSARCNLTASHGPARISLIGTWNLADPNAPWDLHIAGKNLNVDADLAKSMPDGVRQTVEGLDLHGIVSFDFKKLLYRTDGADFDWRMDCQKTSLNVGVPLENVTGSAWLEGKARDGRLTELDGELWADRLLLAGRPASGLQAGITKLHGEPTVRITDLRGTVAGGDLVGAAAVSLPPTGPSRYALNLVLRDADVRQLTGATDPNLSGNLSASLDLDGVVGDPTNRRGRGDVRVSGENMYRIPLILGLLQVTNLSLPISAPFEDAFARYSVEGQLVSLEEIHLSNKTMEMEGHGHIDFASKQVEMSFATQHPNWLSFPLLGAFWNTAQSELLRIHVTGSIESPKVSASSLDTVTTTVDHVFHGEQGN